MPCHNGISLVPFRRRHSSQGQLAIEGGRSKAEILKLDSKGNTAPRSASPSTTFITQNHVEDEGSENAKPFELPAIAKTAENMA